MDDYKFFRQMPSGRMVDLRNPKPEDIDLEDIIHCLSNICRFAGATKGHYSVAEHTYRVWDYLYPDWQFAALLHDAAEAYTGDIISPVKVLISGFSEIERRLEFAICERFDVNPECLHWPEVKRVDLIVLSAEAMVHLPEHEWHRHVSPDPAASAELAEFMRTAGHFCAEGAADALRGAFGVSQRERRELARLYHGREHGT